MIPTLAPERTLTVGSAPVHVVCDGVIVETETDKEGRTICKYKPDPNYGVLSETEQNKDFLARALAALTDPACAAEAQAFCDALPLQSKLEEV